MKLGNGHLWVESIRDLPDRVRTAEDTNLKGMLSLCPGAVIGNKSAISISNS